MIEAPKTNPIIKKIKSAAKILFFFNMNAVKEILNYFRNNGYLATYGSMAMINEALNGMKFQNSNNKIVIFVTLITNGSNEQGHDRADLSVYAAKLCDFDFNSESLLAEQETMMDVLKKMLFCMNEGNKIHPVGSPRWQFGYDDFAENVVWTCCRVSFESRETDCNDVCTC